MHFADNKINVSNKLIFVSERVENIVGKGENDGYELFLQYPQCFQKGFFLKVAKTWDCIYKGLTLSQLCPGFYVSAVQVF